ncbi:unnamed protein product [Calypogeia fissa]
MSCRMACAAPSCVEPWELKKTHYKLAASHDVGKEIRLRSGVFARPIIKGDLLLSIWDTRTTPGPEYVITPAAFRAAVEDLGKLCCDETRNSCRRGTFIFGSTVSLFIMHLEGPNCNDKLVGAAAAAHFATLVEKMSTLAAEAKQTGNKKRSLNSGEKMVVQSSLSVTLAIQAAQHQASVEISTLHECAKNVKAHCCPNPSSCKVGFCFVRDPIMLRTPNINPILTKAVISTTPVDLQCVGLWELKEADYDYAAKNFEGKEIRVPEKGKPVSVLFRGNAALLLSSETEHGAVVSQAELSQRIGELEVKCCNKQKEGCQRGLYIFGEVKMQVRHFRAPICAKTSRFAHKDMEGLVEKAFRRATTGLVNTRLGRTETKGLEAGREMVVETEGSLKLTIQGHKGTANFEDMGVYVSAMSIQHDCCKGAAECYGGEVELVDASSTTGAVGKVLISASSVALGKRGRAPARPGT